MALAVAAPKGDARIRVLGPGIDYDALIAEEVERLTARYKEQPYQTALKPKWPFPDYLKRVIDCHADLINLFGGWRWHSPPLASLGTDARMLHRTFNEVVNLFNEVPGPDGTTLHLREWRDLADQQYCSILGCHQPLPKFDAAVYRAATLQPPNGVKEMNVEFASRHFVKIRAGQKISKAVLEAVRKQFKDQNRYIAMWEKIFERFGQVWAGERGMGITVSVAPSDLLQFGHMGENSCFATGGQHEQSKLHLSLMKNTLGLFFYRDGVVATPPPPHQDRGIPAAGRAFGFVDFDTPGIVLSNIYLLQWELVRPSICMMMEQWFPGKKFILDERRHGTLFPLGGKLVPNMGHEAIRVYVNADTHILAPDKQGGNVHSAIHPIAQKFMKDVDLHHIRIRCSCGQYVTDPTTLVECACGRKTCPTCVVACGHCDTKQCNRCAQHNRVRCDGCGDQFCQKCTEKKILTSCESCDSRFCKKCTQTSTLTCAIEGCEEKFCTQCAATCHVSEARLCATHQETHMRSCDRCGNFAVLAHVTRCPTCRKRRCDACRQDGEGVEPRDPCNRCQERARRLAERGDVQPDPEVLATFGRQLDELDEEVRFDYEHRLRRYRWQPVPADPAVAEAPPVVAEPVEIDEA